MMGKIKRRAAAAAIPAITCLATSFSSTLASTRLSTIFPSRPPQLPTPAPSAGRWSRSGGPARAPVLANSSKLPAEAPMWLRWAAKGLLQRPRMGPAWAFSALVGSVPAGGTTPQLSVVLWERVVLLMVHSTRPPLPGSSPQSLTKRQLPSPPAGLLPISSPSPRSFTKRLS